MTSERDDGQASRMVFPAVRDYSFKMPAKLIIFDFDGVLADSEGPAIEALVAYGKDVGISLELEDAFDRFTGKRVKDVKAALEERAGRILPDFEQDLRTKTFAAFQSSLTEVPGAGAFLSRFRDVPRCIASSSSQARLKYCLGLLGWADKFKDHIFSADQVVRGKPLPDIFLFAAKKMGVAPSNCAVIEDSPGGIKAAKAAGMKAIGLLAASHLKGGHRQKLLAAGADKIAADYAEAANIMDAMLLP